MWNKIFFAVLAAAIVVMSFFTFYAYSWLGSIGAPKDAAAGYDFYAGLSSTALVISTAVLLIIANVILWLSRRGWALWTTFGYFAFFIIVRFFWLEKASFDFRKATALTDGTYFFTAFIGAAIIIVGGAIVFFNQFFNLRLSEKMYPPKETDIEVIEEEPQN